MSKTKLRYCVYFFSFALIGYFYFFKGKDQIYQFDQSSKATENSIADDDLPGNAFSVIKDPEVLEKLERKGLSFSGIMSSLLSNQRAEVSEPSSNFEVYENNSLYRSAVQVISKDLKDIIADENKAAPGSAGVGMNFSKRGFDDRWFKAKSGTYELIGIINRTDRMSMNTETCGELRFIYRLSYNATKPQQMYSRLPMTLMVKFSQPQENDSYRTCQRFAKNWVQPKEKLDEDDYVNWLVSDQGPLSKALFQIENFHSLELNMQAFRVPATVRRKMGGHASYLLRVFKKENDQMVPDYLENMPDVDALKDRKSELFKKFLSFLKHKSEIYKNDEGQDTRTDNFARIDRGVIIIPDEFLAKKAISYSPYGVSRYSNRPYSQILQESDFADMVFSSKNDYVKTPDAVIRRLNDMSCVGCHQGRAMAGFHFLGLDKKSTHPMNALNFEGSGHFQIELERREEFLKKIRKSLFAAPKRDFSIAPPEGKKAGYGHFCGLPNGQGFEHWQCTDGLTCQKSDEAQNEKVLGKCLPQVQKSGDPCMYGSVTQVDRNSDEIILSPTLKCNEGKGQYTCGPVVGPPGTKLGGFPTGMCQALNCKNLDSKTEICGRIAASGFSVCVGDSSKTFGQCLDTYSSPVGLGLCDESRACRNDYVCVRVNSKQGACMPSYFVFQVRQDGHPAPQ